MTDDIQVESSKATQLIARMGWGSRPAGNGDNYAIETCPYDPAHSPWKFFMAVGGEKDGIWHCHICSKSGNLYQLREHLGLEAHNALSLQDMSIQRMTPGSLPDFNALHNQLMNSEEFDDVLDYLVAERKFSLAVIEGRKLGAKYITVTSKDGDKSQAKAYVIPYFDAAGHPVYYKARSIPPAKKAFASPSGREAPLYNQAVIANGLDTLVLVEGEADCLSLLSNGFLTVAGVPGAGVKKAAWIDQIDRVAPKNLYILYDNDKTGQEAAHEMAVRLGLDKVKNVVLPAFEKADGGAGKDVNEWFAAGNKLEDFVELLNAAKPFDVQGVQSVSDVLDDLKGQLEEHGNIPTYTTPWPSLDRRVGGFERGDVCGVMAEGKCGKTTLAMNWVDWFAEVKAETSMLFCGEMPAVRLVRKWVSYKLQVDDTPGRSELTAQHIDDAIELARNYKADLLFGYSRTNSPKEVFDTIRQAVRRYGVKVVCYDNLQLMTRSIEHQNAEISKIMKEFKALAMELGIFIILIIQPHRVGEGQIVAARNAMGSSAIEKDVDAMICLHRNRVGKIDQKDFTGYLDTEENFEPQMLVRVDLSRYAPGGTCTLWMDGARSTVRELTTDMLATATAPVGGIMIEQKQEQPIEV